MQICLIENWRSSHKFWSVRIGAVASGAMAYVFANPSSITDALNSLPPEARAWLSPAVGAVIFGIVWSLRVLDQVKKDEANELPAGPAATLPISANNNTPGDAN